MIEVSFGQLHEWLTQFLWPFARLSAFMMVSPLLGHSSIPTRAKIGIAVILTIVAGATMPPMPEVPIMSWAGVGVIIEQMLIGAALGLVMHIIFAAVLVAGDFIGLQMGLGFAAFFSPDTGANSMVLSRILYMVSLLMFLAFDAHLFMIRILVESFTTLPVGLLGVNTNALDMLVRFSGTIFISGMLLSLPLVIALLIINLALGILNRAAPQFTIFSVGFPMSLIAGMFLMVILMSDLAGFLEGLFAQGLQFMQQLAEAL
ncbi:MAG: flagellar biosynthetic protein FliR [Pseudohongiellaceae bacterium]